MNSFSRSNSYHAKCCVGFFSMLFFVVTILFSNALQAQSLQLTGSVQWVNIGDLDVTGNQITVEALINYQGGVNVVSKHTGPNNVNYLLRPSTFEITTSTQFYLMNNPYTLQTNTWYHIAGVYNGSTISYYVNGCLVIQQAASGNIVVNNLATAIGNISTSPFSEQFVGMIDEVRIWNSARTQAEIAANMNDLPNPATYPNLRGYYKFTNNLLNSGNSGANNGTGVGAFSYGAEPPIIQQLSIVSVVATNVSCFGLNNGSVVITASGSGVQYSLNNLNYQAANNFTGLGPGNYTAYIRSAEGCVLSQTFSITQPAQLLSAVSASICSNQTYSFGGNTYNSSGVYSVINPGSTGCDSTSTLTLTVTPSTGPPPAASTFNTANNGAGGTLAGGSNDLTWTVATNNINGPYAPAVVMTSTGSYYNSPWPDCDWISHVASGSHAGNVDYYYQTQFALPCFNNCGASYADDGVFCLSLDFFADNSVFEIFVNGVPQSATIPGIPVANPYANVGFNQAGMVSVTLCNDWQPGTNTLTIQVSSGGPQAGFLAQAAINPILPPTDTVAAQICSGQSYTFGGMQYNATGQFTHTFQNVNGCDSLVTLDLLVNPTPPQPTITSNSPVCEGQTLQLNTSTVAGATYVWVGPNFWGSISQNPTRPNATIDMSGAYNLAVTVNGCTSPLGTANVVVNPIPPTPVVNINSPLCEGETLFLSGPSGAGLQYVWTGPNAWTANTQTSQINNVSNNENGNYSLFIILNGCTSTTVVEPVVVNPKPVASYIGALNFCGTETELSATANVASPDNINSYLWYVQGSNTPIGAGATIENNFTGSNPTTTITLNVVANSNNDCKDTAIATITLFATPNADFEWEDLCDGSNIEFTDNSNWNGNPQVGTTFTNGWNFGDAQTGINSPVTHAYADTGSYQVTHIVGSSESTCADTITMNIVVHPEVLITLTVTEPECGQTVLFDADINPTSNTQTLDWDFGDGASGTVDSLTHTYQQAGTYNITFTVNTNYNCTFSAIDIADLKPSPSISTIPIPNIITPNGDPINEALLLDNLFADCVVYEMKIMNRWGNLIYTQKKGSAPFSGKGMFGTLLSPGVYFYVIKAGDEEKSGTITINY